MNDTKFLIGDLIKIHESSEMGFVIDYKKIQQVFFRPGERYVIYDVLSEKGNYKQWEDELELIHRENDI